MKALIRLHIRAVLSWRSLTAHDLKPHFRLARLNGDTVNNSFPQEKLHKLRRISEHLDNTVNLDILQKCYFYILFYTLSSFFKFCTRLNKFCSILYFLSLLLCPCDEQLNLSRSRDQLRCIPPPLILTCASA